MKLETGGSLHFDEVSEPHLHDVFRDDKRRGEFVILSQRDETFIQASGEGEGPYVLEYREGDDWHHFTAGDTWTKEQVLDAFVSYLSGDGRWRSDFPWKPL